MDHKVLNVTQLYDDASTLFKEHCIGGDSSADGIINNLSAGIEK